MTTRYIWTVFVLAFWFLQPSYGQQADMVVAQDGSGDYLTIQEAIMMVPDLRQQRTVIRIKPGVYKEKLILPATKTNVSFIGEDAMKTILTYDDYASKKNRYGEEIGTSGSTSFFVFGDGFYAAHITFENSAGPVGQAVAVRVTGTRAYFHQCRFLGHQDTLYPHGTGSKQYYEECYIEGTTDFIFGSATAFFQSCEIRSKKGGSYITAASTPDTVRYGFVFADCRLTADTPDVVTYLGRPWRPYAKTVFINCELGGHIRSEGWHNWGKANNEQTAYYGEYGNTGAGADQTDRVSWANRLDESRAADFSLDNVLGAWSPQMAHQ
ncbi:pectinesterase family protein [Parapedobacter tibetensis]|nr:pectinesterase family protein [Parapedobacter tibetensis]